MTALAVGWGSGISVAHLSVGGFGMLLTWIQRGFLCFLFLFLPEIGSASEAFDVEAMSRFLSALNGTHNIDVSKLDPETNGATKESIPPFITNLFSKIQTSVFGSDALISIQTCELCFATTHLKEKIIYVQPSAIHMLEEDTSYKNPEVVVAFVLAHEMGHIVHELSTWKSDNISINALPSMLRTWLLLSGKPKKDEPLFKSHAEVDTYALIILKNMGYARADDVIQFLKNSYNGDDFNKADLDMRLEIVPVTLSRLWPR